MSMDLWKSSLMEYLNFLKEKPRKNRAELINLRFEIKEFLNEIDKNLPKKNKEAFF